MPVPLTNAFRRKALRAFRQRGVLVHAGAIEQLFATFKELDEDDFPSFLDSVFVQLAQDDNSKSGLLTEEVAERISERLMRDAQREAGVASATVEVIDVFSVPSWQPNTGERNVFAGKRVDAPKMPVIAGLPRAKADMFRMRYDLIKGKVLRNPKFCAPASSLLGYGKNNPYYQLTGIESLAGTDDERLVLGMLTQLEDGMWFLEDLNGTVRVDLSDALVTAGLHTESSFVIAQGQLMEEAGEDPIFKVSAMGTPPCESREESLNALSKGPNLFGGSFQYEEEESLLKMEKEASDTMFLLFSDVALDNSRVCAGLRHVFQGYVEDEIVPKMVVLMGNFLSHPFGQQPSDVHVLSERFTELGKMISTEFEVLAEQCMFVIVPGTNDPGPGNVLPRPAMPKFVLRGFIEALGEDRVFLGTNPCRIRYMTQEIVILRDDLVQKMVRHCAVKPDFDESGRLSEHFLKSIVDQANMCPLPCTARPVLWRHAHAMWLFPLPHVIVSADKMDSFICRYGGTLGLNPGSFRTDFSFMTYLPADRQGQTCSLDSEVLDGDANEENVQSDEEGDGESLNMQDTERSDELNAEEEAQNARHNRENQEIQGLQSVQGEDLSDDNEMHVDKGDMEKGLVKETERSEKWDDEDDESDNDSVIAPEGIEKRDIRTLVRQSMSEVESSGRSGKAS